MEIDPIQVAAKVTSTLEELKVPYFIGGSVASTLHGMVRTTQDVDIVAKLRGEHVQSFVENLSSAFFIDDKMVAEAVARHSSFNIIHRESLFKVDVFVAGEPGFNDKQIARARRESLSTKPEIQAMVSTA